MTESNAFARHQRLRWLRPDAARWLRSDAARYLSPGTKVAEIFPALDRKYSPSQPRTPAGNGRESGRWTSEHSGTGSGGASIFASPMGGADISAGDVSADSDGLFNIAPAEFDDFDLTQLAGDIPEGDSPGIGHNQGPPLEPPEIPTERPDNSADRMKVVWDLARWVARVRGILPVTAALDVATENAEWLQFRKAAILSYDDPPKSLEELQSRVSLTSERGYEDHHIEEQTLLRRLGFSWGEINVPDNVVRIPTLKHIDISAWYGRPNESFGGLSPRDYLRDKDAAERRRVGLDALALHGVMTP